MHDLETLKRLNAAAGNVKQGAPSGLYTVVIEEHQACAWGPREDGTYGTTAYEFTELHVVEVYPAEYGVLAPSKLTGPDWANLAMSEVTDGDSFDHYRLILVTKDALDVMELPAVEDELVEL